MAQNTLTDSATASATQSGTQAALLQANSQPGPFSERRILPVEQAFPLTIEARSDSELHLAWQVLDGYYLYRDKMSFTLNGSPLPLPALPEAELIEDEFFGAVAIYDKAFSLTLRLPEQGQLLITYQGCARERYCYPPASHTFP